MSYSLEQLTEKEEVDLVIQSTLDKVVVLRFGRESDATCMQHDDIVRCLYLYLCSRLSPFLFLHPLFSKRVNTYCLWISISGLLSSLPLSPLLSPPAMVCRLGQLLSFLYTLVVLGIMLLVLDSVM